MAQRGQPILSLVSRDFLNDRKGIIEKLAAAGKAALLNYHYMVQNVRQFQEEEDHAMQQAVTETLDRLDEALIEKLLEELPIEQTLRGLPAEKVIRAVDEGLFDKIIQECSAEQRLRGLPPEERLRGLPPDDVLRTLPKEFVAGLSADDLARLREALKRQQGQ